MRFFMPCLLALLSLLGGVAIAQSGPLEANAITLNPGGGSFDNTIWSKGWVLHRVVAPRRMRVENFDFYCVMNGAAAAVNVALHIDQQGKPYPSASLRGQMQVGTTPGFYRWSSPQGRIVDQGEVFYIGYEVPGPSFQHSLSSGQKGSYFYESNGSWLGPVTRRSFAWRVGSYWRPLAQPIGSSCRTPSTRGQGTGHYARAYSPDATSPNATTWASGTEVAHVVELERDGYIQGISIFAQLTGGSSPMTVRLYARDGANGWPGTLLASTQVALGSSARWNAALFDKRFFARRNSSFYVAYVVPPGYRGALDEGDLTINYYRGPGSSTWLGPGTVHRFGLKLLTQEAEGFNLGATGNASYSPVYSGQTRLHKITAQSDTWVSGFGFRCAASASTAIQFDLHEANSAGEPRLQPTRSVTRNVGTQSEFQDVSFAPVFVPRGRNYFIGYTGPSSSSSSLFDQVTGPVGMRDSFYYVYSASAGRWYTNAVGRPVSYRVHRSHVQSNSLERDNSQATVSPGASNAVLCQAPHDMWVEGFEWLVQNTRYRVSTTATLYLATGSGRIPVPGSAVRAGITQIGSAAGWSRVLFDEPYFLYGGTKFFVALEAPVGSLSSLRPFAASGQNSSYYSQAANSTTWTGPSSAPFALRVHARRGAAWQAFEGEPVIGSAYRIKLLGASGSRWWGLVLGFSKDNWGAIPLPLELPQWPGCQLQVSYDLLLGAGRTDNAGRALLTLPLPNSPSITGLPFYTQFWIVENTSSFELSWTNAGWMEIGG
jgi:hypothetical protein